MLLLTDGCVLAQDSGTRHWWKLTPDTAGAYVTGTWQRVSSSRNAPLYFASAVLRDGRVLVAGGEENNGQPANLTGRAQVAHHQGRRERLDVGDVVEAAADRVRRQERIDVDVQIEQIADETGVFGSVETLERPAAGTRLRTGSPAAPTPS